MNATRYPGRNMHHTGPGTDSESTARDKNELEARVPLKAARIRRSMNMRRNHRIRHCYLSQKSPMAVQFGCRLRDLPVKPTSTEAITERRAI